MVMHFEYNILKETKKKNENIQSDIRNLFDQFGDLPPTPPKKKEKKKNHDI